MANRIEIPAATQARIEKLIANRDTIQALIDTTVLTTREALAVPAEWTMNDLAEGFVPPEAHE